MVFNIWLIGGPYLWVKLILWPSQGRNDLGFVEEIIFPRNILGLCLSIFLTREASYAYERKLEFVCQKLRNIHRSKFQNGSKMVVLHRGILTLWMEGVVACIEL